MAQTGYVPISLYYSTTAATAPTAANLISGELAINITDGILFYKDNAGVVQTLASKAAASGSYTSITLTGGTANGVAYLNGSKVLTTGSALTFDGTGLLVGGSSYATTGVAIYKEGGSNNGKIYSPTSLELDGTTSVQFAINDAEQMRLTSTGLGIGTSSPSEKLTVAGNIKLGTSGTAWTYGPATTGRSFFSNSDGTSYIGIYGSAYGSGLTSTISFVTNSSNTMLMDASGNLGLGVTPSAWTSYKAFQVGATGAASLASSNSSEATVFANAYLSGASFKYINTAAASYYSQSAGAHSWAIAPSGTAGNAISFTQAMTLDASGNLGIGTSSPGYKLDVVGAVNLQGSSTFPTTGMFLRSADNQLKILGGSAGISLAAQSGASTYVNIDSSGNLGIGVTPSAGGLSGYSLFEMSAGGASLYAGTNQLLIGSNVSWNGGTASYKTSHPASLYNQATGAHSWYTAPSGTAGNAISLTQAMTLDASGNLLVGTTSGTAHILRATSGSSYILVLQDNPGNAIFHVNVNGEITTQGGGAPYNNTTASAANMFVSSGGVFQRSTSALKYKQDIRDLELIDVDLFRPVRYKSKCANDNQTKDHFGVIADEVAEAGITELINYGPDGEVEGFQYERLTVVLLKELQSLRKRVAALESK